MARQKKIWISRDVYQEHNPESEKLYIWYKKPILEDGEWAQSDHTVAKELYDLGQVPLDLPTLEHLAPDYGECIEYVLTQTKVLTK